MEWMDRLLAGTVPPAIQLDVLEAADTRPSALLTQKVASYRTTLGTNELAPYRVALEGGSAAAGRAVFNRPEVECIRCHKLYGRGGEVGPELSTVASRLDRTALLASIVTPDLQLAPGYETVLVTLDDTETVAGIAIAETGQQLTLRLPDGTRRDIDKARIHSRERGHSAMPTGLAEILGTRQLRDLVEFLASLK
jgi:quinoprotein glucose dehydrogenase